MTIRYRCDKQSLIVQFAHQWSILVRRDGYVPFSARNGLSSKRYWIVPIVGWSVRFSRVQHWSPDAVA